MIVQLQIIEYSAMYYKYIEDNILPHEDQSIQIKYLKGELGFDEDYVKEHMLNNNIRLLSHAN